MRSDRYSDESLNTDKNEFYSLNPEKKPRKLFGRKKKTDTSGDEPGADLSRMKKKDLLEIMLAQGKEIDKLRERVAVLEDQLSKREFDIEYAGSLAEASLLVTKIFSEADEAAKVYLDNVRRQYGQK